MLFTLFILFIVLPWIELMLLFRVGAAIGGVPTLGLIVLTGVLGASLTRLEGARALGAIRNANRRGEVPAQAILDAFLIFAAGLLLVTPGFLTDGVGFLLLVPSGRALVRWLLVEKLKKHAGVHFEVRTGATGPLRKDRGESAADPDVIDVPARELDDDASN